MKEKQKWEFFKDKGFIYVASRRSDSKRIQTLYIKKKGDKAHKGIKPREIRQLLNVILRTFTELLFEFDKVQFAGNSSTTTVCRNSGAWMLNGCIYLLYEIGVWCSFSNVEIAFEDCCAFTEVQKSPSLASKVVREWAMEQFQKGRRGNYAQIAQLFKDKWNKRFEWYHGVKMRPLCVTLLKALGFSETRLYQAYDKENQFRLTLDHITSDDVLDDIRKILRFVTFGI